MTDDPTLHALFQKQRRSEHGRIPGLDEVLNNGHAKRGEGRGPAVVAQTYLRMAAAAGLLVAVAVGLAIRVFTLGTTAPAPDTLASLDSWTAETDLLLDMGPASIHDAVFHTDFSESEMSETSTDNTQEVL